jgi:hypothetical protein
MVAAMGSITPPGCVFVQGVLTASVSSHCACMPVLSLYGCGCMAAVCAPIVLCLVCVLL